VSTVSAQEILRQAEFAEAASRRGIAHPMIYEKLEVRRTSFPSDVSRTAVVELWHDPGRRSSEWRGESAVSAELQAILRENKLANHPALSVTAFRKWWDSADEPVEEAEQVVLPDGSPAFLLRAASGGPFLPYAIIEGSLLVRAGDWRPLELALRVQVENQQIREYRLRAATVRIGTTKDAAPDASAPLHRKVPEGARPERAWVPKSVARPVAPSRPSIDRTELQAAAIETRYALHRIGACLGDPIVVTVESPARVMVRGLAETIERKEQLMAAVAGLPLVTVQVQTVAEALAAQQGGKLDVSPPHRSTPMTIHASRFPLEGRLEQYFRDRGGSTEVSLQITALANRALSLSDAVMADTWALSRLAEQFPGTGRNVLTASSRWLLEIMARDHTASLRVTLDSIRHLLEPVLLDVVGLVAEAKFGIEPETPPPRPAADSSWTVTVSVLMQNVRQWQQFVHGVFSGAGTPALEPEESAWKLMLAWRDTEASLRDLQYMLARDSSGNPAASAAEGVPE
jgi:hypothetical protein